MSCQLGKCNLIYLWSVHLTPRLWEGHSGTIDQIPAWHGVQCSVVFKQKSSIHVSHWMAWALFHSPYLLLPGSAITVEISWKPPTGSLTNGPTEPFSSGFLLPPPRKQSCHCSGAHRMFTSLPPLGWRGIPFQFVVKKQIPELPSFSTYTFLKPKTPFSHFYLLYK